MNNATSGALAGVTGGPSIGHQAQINNTGGLSQVQGNTPTGNQSAPMMPGQQLNYGNMIYNSNNANQQAMNMFQNAGQFNTDLFNTQMNPYVDNVVQASTDRSWRDFNQQAAPSLQSQFGLGGQFGSARGMQTMEQAVRDNQQQTEWQNANLMNTGFQQAMQNYQAQQQAQLQAAQGMLGSGTAATNQALSQAMLPANQMAVYAGALGSLKTPTLSQSTGDTQSPYFASMF